jgi:ATP-dependent RNA helicase DDX10/DBP4
VPKSINIIDKLVEEFENKDKEDDGPGGLNIEEAKKFIEEEDQFDKQLFREKIKRKHKEEKMKQKELRRAKRAKVKIERVFS